MGGISRYWLGKKGPEMMGVNNPRWAGDRVAIQCWCGNTFNVPPWRARTAKFCSHSCRARFYFTGERNPLWKGGISSWKDQVKGSVEYRGWRMAVFRRDRFSCRKCGYRSKASRAHGDKTSDIHAHHIVPMADSKESWFSIENGIPLCVPHHRETYGKEKNFVMEF